LVERPTVPVQKPHFHLEPYTNDTMVQVAFLPGLSTEDKIHHNIKLLYQFSNSNEIIDLIKATNDTKPQEKED